MTQELGERADQVLGPDGELAQAWPEFVPRDGQRDLARAIGAAMAQGEVLIAEAGTGIGKTFAYLVPALLSGARIVVSTGTRTLQDQLYQRDLPRLLKVLKLTPATALLKGRSNYLCLYRLERAGGAVGNPADAEETLGRISAWAERTTDGDLAGAGFLSDHSALRAQVTSTQDNCLGGECPRYGDCFVMRARRKAQEAELVVVNHHLLFADLKLKQDGHGELLPESDVIVVDEAHQVPDVASRFFGRGITYRQLTELTRDGRAEAGGEAGVLPVLVTPFEDVDGAVRRLRLAFRPFGGRGPWQDVRDRGQVLPELEDLLTALENLERAVGQVAAASAGLELIWHRCARLRAAALPFLEPDDLDHVSWYEVTQAGFSLQRTPLKLSEALGDIREVAAPCWIYTSATLSVKGRFDLFQQQLGLEEADTLSIDSPFDFARRALLYHPPSLPPPNDPGFVPAFVSALLPVLDITGGRAFVLFTSHRNLRLAHALFKNSLDLPIFVQGEAPRHQLLSAFRESGNGVLLGAASFWAGVDVPGDALSCVAVDKLPFAPPDDPVIQARLNRMRRDGEEPFGRYQLPSAVLTLKQGVGRLLRHEDDRGILVLGDERLASRGYGRVFLSSLPPARYTRELADVSGFFA